MTSTSSRSRNSICRATVALEWPPRSRFHVPNRTEPDSTDKWAALLRQTARPAKTDSNFASVLVADLRHFMDMPDDVPGPARRLGEQLARIVRSGTAGDPGRPWISALACIRRPQHRACPGHIQIFRGEVPANIAWRCTSCGDEGSIHGWEDTWADLRTPPPQHHDQPATRIHLDADTVAALRDVMFLDTAIERLVYRAEITHDDRAVLAGSPDDLDELLDSVAAQANHEDNRPHQKRQRRHHPGRVERRGCGAFHPSGA